MTITADLGALVPRPPRSRALGERIPRRPAGQYRGESPVRGFAPRPLLHAVVSNHDDLRPLVEAAGIAFHHVPDTTATKPEAERTILELVRDLDVDLAVLARYMKVLSGDACTALSGRAINIHHSFLPSFVGAKPPPGAGARGEADRRYRALRHARARRRTEIEQDVARVDHSMDATPRPRCSRGR